MPESAILTLSAGYAPSLADTPIAGFQPLVGLGLTDEFKNENDDTFFISETSDAPGGHWLGQGSSEYFDLALLDTGAGASLITWDADAKFDITGEGFDGTELQRLGGATGFFFATVNDPLGMYAAGLGARTGTDPLSFNTTAMRGQTNVSMLTLPPDSDLPNIVGLTFTSQYSTVIRSDQPQVFSHNNRTVRTPNVSFEPLGTGQDAGITMRAPITMKPSNSFLTPPLYVFNFNNILENKPLTEDPTNPTNIQGGMFLTVDLANNGATIDDSSFFFDTGADVTVVSELNAVRLGFDPVLDEPEFTVPVLGSGGTLAAVPGFFVDELTVATVGGTFTATNVPVIAFDVTDVSSPGNIVPGIVGTNVFAGRNLVIDPNPSIGGGGHGPSLYISEPVTTDSVWAGAEPTGTWQAPGSWSTNSEPNELTRVSLQSQPSLDQQAIVLGESLAWDVTVSGTDSSRMTIRLDEGSTLTTFSAVNLHNEGGIELAGGQLDAHFVEALGGFVTGEGLITVGNGPIDGQVEIRSGRLAPGNDVGTLNIDGKYAQGSDATLEIELAGTNPGMFDQLLVDGTAAFEGSLEVALVDPFRPEVGDSFSIVIATEEVGGTFDHLILPDGYQWDVAMTQHNVILSVLGAALLGDLSGDGAVDALDAAILFSKFGTSDPLGDINHDGFVDAADAGIMAVNWTGDAAQTVPEPASGMVAWLLGVSTVLALRRRTG